MTYPPQQPGPYGGPPPQGYGHHPWQGQHPGGYPPPPPPEEPQRNVGKIVAIVAIAVLLVGGVGAGVYFLTREAGPTMSADSTAPGPASTSEAEQEPAVGPEAVVEEYITAYETKSFAAVTEEACAAYKKKYGMNTAQLESQLAKYAITGTAQGAPVIKDEVATARIALELADGADVNNVDIEIKIVKEDGEWRFCGEETA
ncbi:hypothetical protein ACTG9Q_25035 [Actinokineospora sp. 24-640]